MSGTNDFVVKFATVNGSGSASANGMFAKTLFRMGIPVSPKNIFPSNIQGLPTWYEVRVSGKGYLARREGIDLMVASPHRPDYHFIEANERPGLANHEPQPVAERFLDLLFPLSIPQAARAAMQR